MAAGDGVVLCHAQRARSRCALNLRPATDAAYRGRVQTALKGGDLQLAEDLANQYRRLNGYTPEALLALGWAARGELAARQVEKANQTAAEILQNAQTALASRPIDAEPYLPLALGTAYEVQAEALFAKGQRAAALQLMQKALVKWRDSSLGDRLQIVC